eukprot:13098582-Ditylum_brightwellii.AAC.1
MAYHQNNGGSGFDNSHAHAMQETDYQFCLQSPLKCWCSGAAACNIVPDLMFFCAVSPSMS